MTNPQISVLPVLPQIIVEAGLIPDAPVQGNTTLRLDDPTFGLLGTGTLGTAITWTSISPWVLGFTITRPSTRLQGPLWNYQAGTCSILLDNSDGRFDPDNLSSPYISAGITQLVAMVPVRVRTVFASRSYASYSGFADGWLPGQVTYEGGYAEITVAATDAFKVLTGVTLPAVAVEGAGADTGARVADILVRAGWYTSAERRVISTGNSTLQGTALGADALSLMQIAVDSEIGQLYVNGSGAVVFRSRHALLTDTRSATAQAVFGDLPGPGPGNLLTGQDATFEGGTGHWGSPSGCTMASSTAYSHSGTSSLALTSVPAGPLAMSVSSTTTPVSSSIRVVPFQRVDVSAWFLSPTYIATSAQVQVSWYDRAGALIATFTPVPLPTVSGSVWKQQAYTTTAPAGAVTGVLIPSITPGGGIGDVDYVDDVSATTPELPYAAVGRASDDTTIANDIQATIVGSVNLQEVKDAASIAKYLFPRTYPRSDLILQNDGSALNWAQWVLYVSKGGEDRFETISIDPAADPYNLWPQVLGREIGDRIQIWQRPAGVAAAVAKDCFIAGITHVWDSVASTWLTTWTLQDASKYGSFFTLDNPKLGQLDANALTFLQEIECRFLRGLWGKFWPRRT